MTDEVEIATPNIRVRDALGRNVRTPEQRDADFKAANRIARGESYEEVGHDLGLSHWTVRDMVKRALGEIDVGGAEELRRREIMKLDAIEQRCAEVLRKSHMMVSASGRVVTYDGVVVEDDAVILKAADTLLKVAQRRAKLLGLDAPTQVQVEVTHDASAIDDDLAAIRAALAGPHDPAFLVD